MHYPKSIDILSPNLYKRGRDKLKTVKTEIEAICSNKTKIPSITLNTLLKQASSEHILKFEDCSLYL